MLMQVDRVASVEEAVAFRDAGANLIGVTLDRDPRFLDDRFVSPETASAIRQAIAPARVVGHVPTYFDDHAVAQTRACIERVLALRPDFIQFYRNNPSDDLLSLVHAANIPIIREGAEIDDDDRAFFGQDDAVAWVRRQLEDRAKLKPMLFHLDVVTNRVDPWRFLVDIAPEWPDECSQVADIAATTRDLPFLLSLMGLSAETISPYVQAFPDVRGFFARLGPDAAGSASFTEPEPLLAALHALQAL
jgi:hypothetical protein